MQTFGDDEFSKAHPAFIWVFKATRNWESVKELIPAMKDHLASDPGAKLYSPGKGKPVSDTTDIRLDFSTIFKELFCVAAQELAHRVHEPVEKLGVLFEDPLETDTLSRTGTVRTSSITKRWTQSSSKSDVENSPVLPFIGLGQFLLLTRQVTRPDMDKFAAHGYRFASIPHITEPLSKSMRVSQAQMLICLKRMEAYCGPEDVMKPGVQVACFMLRPNVRKGFDVLVPTHAQNQLPHVPLPYESLTTWQIDLLRKLDGLTVATVVRLLLNDASTRPQENVFYSQLYRAISQIVQQVDEPSVLMQARFKAKQIGVPCQSLQGSTVTAKCTLLPICVMNNIYAKPANEKVTYVPLRFFNAQQQLYLGPSDQAAFSRQSHLEFAHCWRSDGNKDKKDSESTDSESLARRRSLRSVGSPVLELTPMTPIHSKPRSLTERIAGLRRSDESNVAGTQKPSQLIRGSLGGIMVSNQISVDVSELGQCETPDSLEMERMGTGTKVEAGTTTLESETYVGELFALLRH